MAPSVSSLFRFTFLFQLILVEMNVFACYVFKDVLCVSTCCIWWTLSCNLQIYIVWWSTSCLVCLPKFHTQMTTKIFCIWISCVFFFLSLISPLFHIYIILWEAWHPETFIFNLIYVLERILWGEGPHYWDRGDNSGQDKFCDVINYFGTLAALHIPFWNINLYMGC